VRRPLGPVSRASSLVLGIHKSDENCPGPQDDGADVFRVLEAVKVRQMFPLHRDRPRAISSDRKQTCPKAPRSGYLAVVVLLLAGSFCLTDISFAATRRPTGGFVGQASAVPHKLTSVRASGPGFLLALGDSLAAGYQPIDKSSSPPIDPATGFPDEGYPGSYASDIAVARGLNLIDLGCPGETTTTMVQKPAEAPCASVYETEFLASSQLQAALKFLVGHKGQVRLVLIDLGANDFVRCSANGAPDPSCLRDGATTAKHNLPVILAKLRKAMGLYDPGARLIGMNYYDPFLSLAFRPGGQKASAEAVVSLVLLQGYNVELQAIYQGAKVQVANVAEAFGSDSTIPLTTYGGKRVARNVALVCRWTWMCPISPAKGPPDIHANSAGYRVIAGAFERLLIKS
jgi:lysophospholipase L1-like esterase